MATQKQVKYGMIACGAIAQRRHIREAAANPKSKVVAVVDCRRERADEMAERYGATAYDDHKQMLKEADIDAVVVAGPNKWHAPHTLDAFKAGKHVLVEKPMATSRQDAKKMIAAGKKAGKFLMIGLNQRLMPPHQKARQILQSGVLGDVLSFRTTFKHPGPEGWSIENSVDTWFFRPDEAGMGVNGDLGVHKADLMRWLLDDEFVEVGGFLATRDKRGVDGKLIKLDDNAYFSLKSKSGAIGSMEISWTAYGAGENHTVLYCKNGTLQVGYDPTYGVIVDYRNGNQEMHKVGAMATNQKQTASGIIDSFTDCILENRKPEIDGEEGYKCLNIILTAIEAAKEGKVKKIA